MERKIHRQLVLEDDDSVHDFDNDDNEEENNDDLDNY